MLIKKEAGTKRRKWKKNIYKFIPREEDSITSHIMFVPTALMQFQVAAGTSHTTFAKNLRCIFNIMQPKQTYSYVAEGGHYFWPLAQPNLGTVFIKCRIPNPI